MRKIKKKIKIQKVRGYTLLCLLEFHSKAYLTDPCSVPVKKSWITKGHKKNRNKAVRT